MPIALLKFDSVKPPVLKLDDSFNSPKFKAESGKSNAFLPMVSKKTTLPFV